MKQTFKNGQLEEIAGLTPEYPFVHLNTDYNTLHISWHWHEEVEFNYIIAGKVKVKTLEKEFIFSEGEAYFVNGNVLATMGRAEGEPESRADTYLFHPIFLSGHFRSIFETKYMDPIVHNKCLDIIEIRGKNDTQKALLKKLRQASILQEKEDSEFQLRNLFSEIWLLLLEESKDVKKTVSRENQDRIQSMMSYIHLHYQEKITLDDIAASASISTRECLRSFQKSIQKTPFEYLLDYRVEKAEYFLRTTQDSIVTIALQCGFSNSSYFCKVYKELRQTTPGKYRKTVRGRSDAVNGQ